MHRLKNVRHRRTDALTQVSWDGLESLLAIYYRGQGYRVEHVGTGASRARFDGGIDLKLYKDDAYIVVQCKHWNAKQVTHNAVHELIGVMITEGASGAILVTSGEFSRYAIESAAKQGHVQLVDGDDLREMLGPLPAVAVPAVAVPAVAPEAKSLAANFASTVGERLLGAAEARIRGDAWRPPGGRGRTRGRSTVRDAMRAGLWMLFLKLLFALVIAVILIKGINNAISKLGQPMRGAPTTRIDGRQALPTPGSVGPDGVLRAPSPAQGAEPVVIDHYTGTTLEERPAGMPAYRPPSVAEVRESQRRADEAARIIEASTPEI